jgi:hypothetical protein
VSRADKYGMREETITFDCSVLIAELEHLREKNDRLITAAQAEEMTTEELQVLLDETLRSIEELLARDDLVKITRD